MKVFASMGARCVAFFIDALLLCVVWASLAAFSGEQGFPLPWWSFIALAAIYFTTLTASPWQGSLGKKSLSIKVTDLAGKRVGLGRALLRFTMTCVMLATAGLGFLIAAWTPRRRALEDFAAGTVVVHAQASPAQIETGVAPPMSWGSRIAAIVGIAAVVFMVSVVVDMYRAVIVRDATRDLLSGMGEFKSQVTDALNEQRAVPAAAAKLPPHARALTARPDGTIILETTDDLFTNGRYIFKPEIKDARVAGWDCRAENIETKYLPATCR